MGRTILADSHGVVGEDVECRELRESGDTDGGTAIVAEDQEGGAGYAEDSVIGVAVHDRAHGVFADAEVDVPALVVLAGEVTSPLDVVESGTEEVGASADEQWHCLGDRLEGDASGLAGGDDILGLEMRDRGQEIGNLLLDTRVKECRQLRIGGTPCGILLLPGGVGRGALRLEVGKVGGDFGGDEEFLFGQPETLACLVGELHAGLAVRLVGALDLGDALADHGAAHDHVRLALGGLGMVVGGQDGSHVVAVDLLDIPAVGLVACGHILALAHIEHGVEGDVVRVEEKDQVVQTEVPRKRGGLAGNTFLKATVTAEDDDMVVEDGVLRGVEARGCHLLRHGDTDTVGHALA